MSSYWSKRQNQLYKSMEKDESALKERLSSFYESEYSLLDKEIAAYYQKYGTNNVIEYRTLMQTLSAEDVKLLIEKTDEFTSKYPQYAHLVPVRNSIYKLNRLEGLQYSVVMQQLKIGAVDIEKVTKHLDKQALKGLNAAMETLGFGKNFYSEGADIIKQFVDVEWSDGLNFSSRIWKNTEKLANYLNTDIAQGFARGDSYEKLTARLRKRFEDVSKNDAYRLIYTEGTFVLAESTMQPFTEDFEKYKVSTAGDGKVCSICSGIARNEYYIKDRKAGVNFPPFHGWCRCTFEIVVDDWDEWMDKYAAKHSKSDNSRKILNNFNDNDKISAGKSPYSNRELIYNPNGKYNISLDNYPLSICEKMSEVCKSIAKLGYKDGKEHLSLLNLATGSIEYTETGTSTAVGGTEFWKYIHNNRDKSFAFIHNHNSNSQFSERDLQTLLGDNPIKMFVISRYDGKCFIVEGNGKIPKTLIFDLLYENELAVINQKVKEGIITQGERTYQRERMLVDNVIRDYTKGVKEFE